MPKQSYEDAPLWTVLATLAAMPKGEARMVDLARKVKTSSGITGAYRAIGRLTSAGYAVLDEGDQSEGVPHMGARVTVRLTITGRTRHNLGQGLVPINAPDRINHSGGFGVVHRRRWVAPPAQTR